MNDLISLMQFILDVQSEKKPIYISYTILKKNET
jgi:hypothetical protein